MSIRASVASVVWLSMGGMPMEAIPIVLAVASLIIGIVQLVLYLMDR